jgi:magnesium transporter
MQLSVNSKPADSVNHSPFFNLQYKNRKSKMVLVGGSSLTENNYQSSSLPTYPRKELRQLVRSQLKALLEQGDFQGAKAILQQVQEADIAEAIEGLPETMQVIAFRLLSKDEAIAVYEYLDSSVQQSLCEKFKRQEVIDIVDKMSPDDRAKLFDELPAILVRRLLGELIPREREATAQLLGYEASNAGRIMTPEYISLKESFTVAQALDRIRSLAKTTETIYSLYVTDAARRLSGILSLRDLVTSPLDKTVGEIMTREVVSVQTGTDQEEVARLIQRYDFLAVPVVDREQRLVGIITVDDAIDILEQEAAKDIYTLGGVQSGGDNYFQTDLITVSRKRVVGLFVLLLTNTVTGAIIRVQEDILQQVVALAAFIPLLTGTGGNVGAQSSTVVIRGLNTDEITAMGPFQVIVREGMAGALLGAILGTVATAWPDTLQGN